MTHACISSGGPVEGLLHDLCFQWQPEYLTKYSVPLVGSLGLQDAGNRFNKIAGRGQATKPLDEGLTLGGASVVNGGKMREAGVGVTFLVLSILAGSEWVVQ